MKGRGKMSKEFEFIQECGYFYVITINGDFPAARPFGAMIEVDGALFIGTHDRNEVHKQLRENGNIQILAKKEQSREWLRITGIASECNDHELKQRFIDESPALARHHKSADSEHYLMFRIKVIKSEFH